MPIVTTTRLRIRTLRHVPAFFWWTFKSLRQARRAPGHLQSAVRAQDMRTYWTISSWESLEAMRRYRNSGPHQTAMRRAGNWAEEVSTVRWEDADGALPQWTEAQRRLDDDPQTLRYD